MTDSTVKLAPRVVSTLERAAWVGAIVVAGVGVIVLCGWAFDVEALRQFHPSLGAMKVNAAIAFVLAGIALALALRRTNRVRTSRALSTTVSVIGALTLLEYLPIGDLGIDDLLFVDEETMFAPGRMSATSAAGFFAIGVSLLCLDTRSRKGHVIAEWLALGTGLVSLLALLGNLYGVRTFVSVGGAQEVALHPAATMAIVSGAILCARPRRGLMRVVASEGPGGSLARRLLPAAILLPALIGALLIAGEEAGFYDVEHETALFASTTIVCFTALTWWTASRILSIDIARRAAEAAADEAKARADAQLVRSQKMETVSRLAGGIAHDFNNLLTVIITYGHLLQRRALRDDPNVGEMVRAAQRAGELTRQLLALSRRQVLQPTVVSLADLLDAMTPMLRSSIGEDVELEMTIARPLDPVHVDAGQMEQVVLNLVVNARDAIPQGGRIAITVDNVEVDAAFAAAHPPVRVGDYVRIVVRDTGTGMDPATVAQIFEPYFTTKEAAKGTGLGLPTALGIVEQSGGAIRVESAPGKGTAFEVYLPVHAGSVPETTARRVPTLPPINRETILLVEDDEHVRAIVGSVLREHGYTVIEASTPGDALLIAEQAERPFDVLLTDVVMPRMGGRQLAERLSEQRPGLRVLFMSGHTDDAILRHGVETSAVAFIEKPMTPDALLAKLREVIDAKRPPVAAAAAAVE